MRKFIYRKRTMAACVAIAGLALCGTMNRPSFAQETDIHGVAIGQERLFEAGVISTGRDLLLTMESDGNTVYFTRWDRPPRGHRFGSIRTSTFKNGAWTQPVVASFSGAYTDVGPFVSPDGSNLLFRSNRPARVGEPRQKHHDIWMVTRQPDRSWGNPKRLGPPVNSEHQDVDPAVSQRGTLFFSSNRNGGFGRGDLYFSQLVESRYTDCVNLGARVNSSSSDSTPYITPDEDILLFSSDRAGGLGGMDLYICYSDGNGWTKPENLGPTVNTSGGEVGPFVTPDMEYLVFTRSGHGRQELYYIKIKNTIVKLH